MNSHDVTVTGYVVVLATAVALQLASRRPDSSVASLDAVVARAMRSRPTRVALIAGWAWLGLHFFAG